MPEGDRAVKCDLRCESDADCKYKPARININLGSRKKKFDQDEWEQLSKVVPIPVFIRIARILDELTRSVSGAKG